MTSGSSYPSVAGVLLEKLPELIEEDVPRGFALKETGDIIVSSFTYHQTGWRLVEDVQDIPTAV